MRVFGPVRFIYDLFQFPVMREPKVFAASFPRVVAQDCSGPKVYDP
jgi:hypothetical protein